MDRPGIWAVALAIFIGLAVSLLADALSAEFHLTNDADSVVGDRLVEERLSGPPKFSDLAIITSEMLTVDDVEFQRQVEAIFGTIVGFGDEIVESAIHTYDLPDDSLVSADRHSAVIPYTFAIDVANATENAGDVRDAIKEATSDPFDVIVTGRASVTNDFFTISQEDAEKGESIAIPIAIVILIAVFGAVVAALVPLIIAAISIAIAMGMVALFGLFIDFNLFVTNVITMIGLAVGIDHCLFIVYRYRAERGRGLDKYQAIARTGATASRAVFFSGMTVVIALTGLLLVPMDVFNGLGAGAMFVVVASVIAALTLLPAVLSVLGENINRLTVPLIGPDPDSPR